MASRAEARERTDVVTLRSGLRVPGEIIEMSLGRLFLRTDDMGRISIEWLRVSQVSSTYTFAVEFSSGNTYFGPLQPGAEGELLVGTQAVRLSEVVSITSVDDRFWNRVRAFADLGFSLAKANTAITLSADGGFEYRAEQFGGSASFTTYLQDSSQVVATTENSLSLTGSYFFKPWRASLLAGLEQNAELDLDLRLSLGGDVAYAAVRNSLMELWVGAGLTFGQEHYAGLSPDLAVAAFFDANWKVFRYASPEIDGEVELSLLPVLNDLGRVRGTASARVKYEVFSDVNVGLSLIYTFDTRPPEQDASRSDYRVTMSIGWSHRR